VTVAAESEVAIGKGHRQREEGSRGRVTPQSLLVTRTKRLSPSSAKYVELVRQPRELRQRSMTDVSELFGANEADDASGLFGIGGTASAQAASYEHGEGAAAATGESPWTTGYTPEGYQCAPNHRTLASVATRGRLIHRCPPTPP
jgi:hypothetical protein